jgi:hypothetical protein
MTTTLASADMHNQLYGTYDGAPNIPSMITISPITSPQANMLILDKIPDHITIFPCDGVKSDPCVIGPAVCQSEWDSKPKKEVWQVSYVVTGLHQWATNIHVVASNLSEALALCARNGIPEAQVKTMQRLDSAKVLY